jgi:hypothetical protein
MANANFMQRSHSLGSLEGDFSQRSTIIACGLQDAADGCKDGIHKTEVGPTGPVDAERTQGKANVPHARRPLWVELLRVEKAQLWAIVFRDLSHYDLDGHVFRYVALQVSTHPDNAESTVAEFVHYAISAV